MSKLSRRIRNVGRPATGTLGFAPAATAERPRQLLVIADAPDADAARAALEAGADAVLVPAGAAADVVQAAADRPVGVRLGSGADAVAATEAATSAGADFIVFDDAATPAAALLRGRGENGRGGLGRVLVLGEDRDEERLRAIAALNLDAVLVDGVGEALTVREQLALRRIAALAGSSLIAAPAGEGAPSREALEVWRDAGAMLVLVRADRAVVEATAAAAREVPPPHRERDDRPPLVPFVPAPQEQEEYEPI